MYPGMLGLETDYELGSSMGMQAEGTDNSPCIFTRPLT